MSMADLFVHAAVVTGGVLVGLVLATLLVVVLGHLCVVAAAEVLRFLDWVRFRWGRII